MSGGLGQRHSCKPTFAVRILTAARGSRSDVQIALLNVLIQAVVAIQEGDLAEAIDKLRKAIVRTDGCALRDAPDGNGPGRDWITDCDAQAAAYTLLTDALNALQGA